MIYLKQCIMNSSVHISHVGLPSPARSRSLICISWNSLSFIWWTTSSFSSFVFALLYPFALCPSTFSFDQGWSSIRCNTPWQQNLKQQKSIVQKESKKTFFLRSYFLDQLIYIKIIFPEVGISIRNLEKFLAPKS